MFGNIFVQLCSEIWKFFNSQFLDFKLTIWILNISTILKEFKFEWYQFEELKHMKPEILNDFLTKFSFFIVLFIANSFSKSNYSKSNNFKFVELTIKEFRFDFENPSCNILIPKRDILYFIKFKQKYTAHDFFWSL